MRIRNVLLAFIAAMGLIIGTNGLLAQQEENAAIEQVMRQMGDAYNKKDLVTFEKICDPNILMMEQGGKYVGWAEFRDKGLKGEWDSLTDFNWDVGKIQVHFVGQDSAWATSEGSFWGKMKDGTQLQGSAMQSCIFQKKSGAWKLVHAHFSSVPTQK
jgi:ketosteroid isomerase-like protein